MKCPVCERGVGSRRAAASLDYNGRQYRFYSRECKEEFLEAPQRYVPWDGPAFACPLAALCNILPEEISQDNGRPM